MDFLGQGWPFMFRKNGMPAAALFIKLTGAIIPEWPCDQIEPDKEPTKTENESVDC